MATKSAIILHEYHELKFVDESVYDIETGEEIKGIAIYVTGYPFCHLPLEEFKLQLAKVYPYKGGKYSKAQLHTTMVKFAQGMAIRN